MAPLDPASKSQVMTKLKNFCSQSVVLVIYHADVGWGPVAASSDAYDDDAIAAVRDGSGTSKECVPSNDFFDHNLHVENKRLVTRHVC